MFTVYIYDKERKDKSQHLLNWFSIL